MSSLLKEYSRTLRLGNIEKLIDQVEYQNREQYVTDLMKLIIEERNKNRIDRLIRKAGFPSIKTLDNYEFSPITFPQGLNKETLLTLDFIDNKENILMLGAVGTGKTHLSIALGVMACMAGKEGRFYRTGDLTTELLELHEKNQVSRFVKKLEQADLLILDEVGYVPTSKRASELLFTVISNCYERQSIIVTSNLELGRWNEVFGDDRLTAALIDRMIHHAHILVFKGESYRYKQALMRK